MCDTRITFFFSLLEKRLLILCNVADLYSPLKPRAGLFLGYIYRLISCSQIKIIRSTHPLFWLGKTYHIVSCVIKGLWTPCHQCILSRHQTSTQCWLDVVCVFRGCFLINPRVPYVNVCMSETVG